MTGSAQPTILWTVEEYLEGEPDGASRHEFVNGAVFAMAGGSAEHNIITLNISSALNVGAPESCQVFATDMKVRTKSDADERYYYPDVMVTCSPDDRDRHSRRMPVLVVEVLSPGTERVDRLEKLPAYRAIPSVQEIALVSQDSLRVEIYRRRVQWVPEVYGKGDTIAFESVGVSITIEDVYRRVEFPSHRPW